MTAPVSEAELRACMCEIGRRMYARNLVAATDGNLSVRIGEGRGAAELIAHRKTVVEGYRTTESFHGLCVERKIDAPILREMHAILFEGKAPALALNALMTRGLKRE